MLLTSFLAALGTTSLVHLLVAIVVLALVIFVIYWLMNRIGIPEPWKTVIYVIIGLIILVYGLNYFGFW